MDLHVFTRKYVNLEVFRRIPGAVFICRLSYRSPRLSGVVGGCPRLSGVVGGGRPSMGPYVKHARPVYFVEGDHVSTIIFAALRCDAISLRVVHKKQADGRSPAATMLFRTSSVVARGATPSLDALSPKKLAGGTSPVATMLFRTLSGEGRSGRCLYPDLTLCRVFTS